MVDARTNLALASLMAGAAFSNAMVGIVHAIGHSLGGLCHVPHGQAMMMLLPHCVKWNLDHGIHTGVYGELLAHLDPARDAQLAHASADERDRAVSDALFALNEGFHANHGVPLTLRELGIEHDQLQAVAKQAALRWSGALQRHGGDHRGRDGDPGSGVLASGAGREPCRDARSRA